MYLRAVATISFLSAFFRSLNSMCCPSSACEGDVGGLLGKGIACTRATARKEREAMRGGSYLKLRAVEKVAGLESHSAGGCCRRKGECTLLCASERA